MDLIAELGALALGSRMKRLSNEMLKEVDKIYRYAGVDFQSQWFTTFYAIYKEEQMAITEIAKGLSISHAAVNKFCKGLLAEGLIEESKDSGDERRRLVILSAKGKSLASELEPTWASIQEAVSELILESSFDILSAIHNFEDSLAAKSLSDRAIDKIKRNQLEEVTIEDFQPKYAKYFASLNYEWLDKYFEIEEIDRRVLDHSQKEVINKGGYILFAKYKDEIVGTVALMKHDDTSHELTKMAVTEKCQGKQIGKKLMVAALNKAKDFGIRTVFLESNTKLVPAITMYKKIGFIVVPVNQGTVSEYKRSNIKMVMEMKEWEGL